VQIHRVATLSFDEVAVRGSLRLTSAALTICDVAGIDPPGATERVLAEARVQKLAISEALDRLIERTPTLKGSSVIRQLLRASTTPAEPGRRPSSRCAGSSQPPGSSSRSPTRSCSATRSTPVADQRLVVEVDGYQFHGHRHSFESDRRRDQQLVAAGYRVIRVTWLQLRDQPVAVVASIAQALALAG
jgi:hypothetical protein